jgi:hypothetical protein
MNTIMAYGPEKLRGMPTPVPPGHKRLRNKTTGSTMECPEDFTPVKPEQWDRIDSDQIGGTSND